jgi:hypothetical protein
MMRENYRVLIFAISLVAAVIPGVFIIHDYIYYISPLEKITFEQVFENCNIDCKMKLEDNGFACEEKNNVGYVCVPSIDPQRIEQRRDYWDNLSPANYGYLEAIYVDGDMSLGLLRDIAVIDENQIKATFRHDVNDKYGDSYVLPEHDYERIQTINVGEAFIPRCNNQYLFVYKLHDIVITETASYAVFVYRIGTTDIDRCVFPGILESSFKVKFDI